MSELESTDGAFQLGPDDLKSDHSEWNSEFLAQHREGDCVSSGGKFRFMVDRSLWICPSISRISTLDWVTSTDDKLFKDLEVSERAMLYMVFYEELSWKRIAQVHNCDVVIVKSHFNEIIDKIRSIAKIEVAD
ncbi:sigma-70 family RNA polymerase sigma factor [Edaphobacter modestus]|uniref:Uncharacterized protein n=1 Tax=Edaphobacter modestus TaxID=388466 RepID=A0A4V2G4C1_9BACT|nr:sigma-70 family RNA polymerase sigma factor [Edaphobacter modestus]RZU40336.1 hypothetical protein BDD14_1785 [Edaphobacter modestus]